MENSNPDYFADLADTVRHALAEDIGGGDLTAALIPRGRPALAEVIAREAAVVCGKPWFDEVFRQIDTAVRATWHVNDGEYVAVGEILVRLEGPARSILSGERTALNFLQTLSGTATVTRRFVEAVQGTKAVILDTRKTLPGLRRAQKYAVACGGGRNHRMGLHDAILIKENHIAAAGSVEAALASAAEADGVPVEIEVENLKQLRAALAAGARRILLDNFGLAALAAAVRESGGRALLEASGGVTLDNVAAIAATGVDFISVGGLTKHLHATDLSLRFKALE